MSSWPTSGWIKIEWAKKQIGNLHAEAKAFFEGQAYAVHFEYDPEAGKTHARIKGGPLPLHWSAVCANIVHDLRTALDYLWRQAMRSPPRARKVYFPVCDSPDEFEAKYGRQIKTPRKQAVDLLRAIKPYKGGNDALWHLDVFDRKDKHEMLTLACCVLHAAQFESDHPFIVSGVESVEELVRTLHLTPIGDVPHVPVQDGTILFSIDLPASTKVQMKAKLSFGVAFGKGEILEGHPVVPSLHHFAELVEGIADTFLEAGLIS